MHPSMQTTNVRYSAMRAALHAAAESPINHAGFQEVWGCEPSAQLAMLREYAGILTTDCAALKAALTRHNARELSRVAHRIAGASQVVAALRVVEACRQVETAIQDRNWPAIYGLVDSVCNEAANAADYIKSL